MLEKIFRKHYSKKYSYVLDAIFLFFSVEIILFLNNSSMIIRSNSDKFIFILICLVSITIFKGYVMLLRFTTFIDIGKIRIYYPAKNNWKPNWVLNFKE